MLWTYLKGFSSLINQLVHLILPWWLKIFPFLFFLYSGSLSTMAMQREVGFPDWRSNLRWTKVTAHSEDSSCLCAKLISPTRIESERDHISAMEFRFLHVYCSVGSTVLRALDEYCNYLMLQWIQIFILWLKQLRSCEFCHSIPSPQHRVTVQHAAIYQMGQETTADNQSLGGQVYL